MTTITPHTLILSHSLDYSCDFICRILNDNNIPFFRLNRDQFHSVNILLEPAKPELTIQNGDFTVCIKEESLYSIFYRAPTFLRENKRYESIGDEISTTQWAAFLRSLVVFENILWVNSPDATYKAEIKSWQLKKAYEVGLNIPYTIVSNAPHLISSHIPSPKIAYKSIDTLYIQKKDSVGFLYTNFIDNETLSEQARLVAPLSFQEALQPKNDLRVTVIGNEIFPFSIESDLGPIENDWRLQKNDLRYIPTSLPDSLVEKLLRLVELLNLSYCGIDLIERDNQFYFIEANPTGEWSWLMRNTGIKLDQKIVSLLAGTNVQ
ncbi:hypothetical protein LF599_05460 [Pseudodesulfovibrio thermohalotolerans]|uniref:hypothetical protein n=1 Tax=Pseudodesulfovibrio thermohalotolerans TaxID=2880651 RepID=UPI0024410E25|nr:hypothetical protein [Pseudodesulfovibrio thermohalotolerans]WFS63612.1 hypothetical protein LF599_05460 [Pseudodesulfovibrio thermohalotolerans]